MWSGLMTKLSRVRTGKCSAGERFRRVWKLGYCKLKDREIQYDGGGEGVKFLIGNAHGLGVPQLKIDEMDNMVE